MSTSVWLLNRVDRTLNRITYIYILSSLRTTARFGSNLDEGRRVWGGGSNYKDLVGASLIGESISALSIKTVVEDLANKHLLRRQIQGSLRPIPTRQS
jgi:hypothetical protein